MKIALLGAAGRAGSRIARELLRRGHAVTGISRHPEAIAVEPGLAAAAGDVQQPGALAGVIAGHEAVIHSVPFVNASAGKTLSALRAAGVARLLVVGGAGSLLAPSGQRLIDTPALANVPYRPEALAGVAFLDALRAERGLDWTFLSPPALFAPGERTGKFRLGGDQLLIDAAGQSHISMEDYAIALVDELESPRHSRQRFTVGY